MPDYSKKIIYLSKAQYQELITNESITVDGVTINYNENDLYVTPQDEPVTDVQVNGVSVVNDGVAEIPIAGSDPGVVKINSSYGISKETDGTLSFVSATGNTIKYGQSVRTVITPGYQDYAVFYGLSKIAGANLSSDTVTLGQYPEKSISAISQMLNAPVSVSGTTPTITAKSGVRYICGEVSTLTITAPESGCIDVMFTSGSTPTVLTVTTAKANTTIKFPAWFDPTSLDADTTYEVNILDGEFGVVTSWV